MAVERETWALSARHCSLLQIVNMASLVSEPFLFEILPTTQSIPAAQLPSWDDIRHPYIAKYFPVFTHSQTVGSESRVKVTFAFDMRPPHVRQAVSLLG